MSGNQIQSEIEQYFEGFEVGIVRDVRMIAHHLIGFCGIEPSPETVLDTEQRIRDHIHTHTSHGVDVWLEDEDFDVHEDFADSPDPDIDFYERVQQRYLFFCYWHEKIYGDSPSMY